MTAAGRLRLRSGPPGFLPTDVAGLTVWLKADAIGVADGTAITSWADSSGNANDFSNGTPGQAPIVKTNILNGEPIVRFDGVDDYLLRSNPLSGSTPGTLLLVTKMAADPPASTPGSAFPLGEWGPSGSTDHFPYSDGNVYLGWGSTTRYNCGNPSPSLASWGIHVFQASASNWKMWINGGAAAFANGSNTIGWKVGTVNVGASGGTWSACDLAEAIVYNSAVSLANINAAAAYLAAKYGLAWTTAT